MTDNLDDLVDDVDGFQQAFQDVGTLLGLVQFKLGPAHHDLMAELDEIGNQVLQRKRLRTALHQGHVVDGKAGLESGIFEQGIQHHVRVAPLLDAEHHADTLTGGLIINVSNAFETLVLDHLADLLNHLFLVHHVRDFRHHDGLTSVVGHLDFRLGTDHHAAAARFVGFLDTGNTADDTARREIRSLDVLHQTVRIDIGIVDIGADGVAALSEVVGCHVGGHTHRNTGRAVQQQQRSLGGEHRRLFDGIVEVQGEIYRILVQVSENILGNLLQFGFRITHGRHGVSVHRTEVTLAIDQAITLVPVLGETSHGVVHAGIAVRVEFTQHLTDDTGALLGLARKTQAQAVHAEQHPSLDGFQAVPHIRQRTGNDDRH